MAESVKRRVAAARLAVAFAAAAAITGAAAAGQQNGPAPILYKQTAYDAFLKLNSIKSENIVDGSLLFKDFKKGQVPSMRQFYKERFGQRRFEKVVFNNYLKIDDAAKQYLKYGDGYIKQSDADARYVKMTDDVVRGKGSVFTETALVDQSDVQLLNLPDQLTVDALKEGRTIRITNTGGGTLTHTSCDNGGGGMVPGGSLQPGDSVECATGEHTETLQFVVDTAGPTVMTLSFSALPAVQSVGKQVTTQILVGL